MAPLPATQYSAAPDVMPCPFQNKWNENKNIFSLLAENIFYWKDLSETQCADPENGNTITKYELSQLFYHF